MGFWGFGDPVWRLHDGVGAKVLEDEILQPLQRGLLYLLHDEMKLPQPLHVSFLEFNQQDELQEETTYTGIGSTKAEG